jgi:peptide/nickel transport system permease protein
MWKYILKRLLYLIPVIAGVILIVYLVFSVAPGDPARVALGDEASQEALEEWREARGLNDPIIVQYGRYLIGIVQGDFGNSFIRSQSPVFEEISAKFPYTFQLAISAMLISLLFSFPLGVFAAIKQNTWFDSLSMFIALIGVSMPQFWLGMLLMLTLSLGLGWFPTGGANQWHSIVLPAISLGFGSMAGMARTTRSSMLEVVRQDFIRTARSKGISKRKVVTKHAIPNALIPSLTVVGIQMGNLLAGSVVVETVFSWPGIGRLMIQSILSNDYPMVLGCMVLYTVCFSLINLLIDIAYAYVDPRIKARYS